MNNIEIYVDKRIELAGILLLLADENNRYIKKCKANTSYLNSIQKHFGEFRQLNAIKIIQKYRQQLRLEKGINIGSSLFGLTLRLNENLEVEPGFDNVGTAINQFWAELKKELPNFIKASRFEEFYNANLPMYKTLIDNAKQEVDTDKINNFMRSFYGKYYDDKKLRIINLCPLINPCTSRKTKQGYHVCICALDEDEKEMQFIGATAKTSSSAVHEFSHPIVNPIIEQYNPIPTEFYSDIIPKIKSTIGNFETFGLTVELVVRALQIVYLRHIYKDKPEWAEWKLNYNKQVVGFGSYMDLFVEKLEAYYTSKDKNKDFKTFLPKMLDEINNSKNLKEDIKPQ